MIRYTEIKNRKNHTLRAMLNLPDGVSHPPVVLNLHGFGGSLSGINTHIHILPAFWKQTESPVFALTSTAAEKVTENSKK